MQSDKPKSAIKDMDNREGLEMMRRCKAEIDQLRRSVNFLRPKAEAWDNLTIILGLLPKPNQSAQVDLIWTLEKRISELTPPSERDDSDAIR